ncbi:MAG: CARDB domain-containing protein [Patescibacteria group bacterium]
MEILRTIIRFLIITIAIGILVFLSVTLFKLIPKGINQLASATVAITDRQTNVATTTATSTYPQQVANPAPVTDSGLNGVYTTKGDIVILEATPNKTGTKTQTAPKTVTYSPTPSYTYYPSAPVLTGRKNLHVSLSSIGIINANGQYVTANSFNTQDTISVRFLVINEQDTPTGPWSLRVDMPAIDTEDRVKILNSLDSIPGESTYTVEARFSGVDLSQGTPIVRINLDPYNQIAESNEGDNTLSAELRNVYQNNYYSNSYTNPYTNYGTNYNYNNNTNGVSYNCAYYSSIGYVNSANYNTYCSNYNNTTYNSYLPNLYIISFETGKITNGTFYAQSYLNYGDRLAIRAKVRNNGSYFTNSWANRISVIDANGNSRDYVPGSESGLSSGSETTIQYEIDSYNLSRGSNRIMFVTDTQNNISESNESDNTYQTYVQVN